MSIFYSILLVYNTFHCLQEKSNLESKVSELSSERDKLSERLTNLGVIGDPAERMQKELDSAR